MTGLPHLDVSQVDQNASRYGAVYGIYRQVYVANTSVYVRNELRNYDLSNCKGAASITAVFPRAVNASYVDSKRNDLLPLLTCSCCREQSSPLKFLVRMENKMNEGNDVTDDIPKKKNS